MEHENTVYVSAYTPPSDTRTTYIHLRKNFAGEIRDFQESLTLFKTYTLPMRARAVLEKAAALLEGKPGLILYTVAGGFDSRPNLAYGQQYREIKPEDNPTFKALKEHITQLERNTYA